MADGMPGMPWKEALKRLKEYCAGDAMVGEPPAMQKELEGLEESLKGWETRDQRREACLGALTNISREKVATQLLAGALAFGGTTFSPIFYVDAEGPDNSGIALESYRLKAARMTKNAVTLADMLLAELAK